MQKILGEFSTNTNGENKKYRWIKVREIQIQIQMVKGRNTVEKSIWHIEYRGARPRRGVAVWGTNAPWRLPLYHHSHQKHKYIFANANTNTYSQIQIQIHIYKYKFANINTNAQCTYLILNVVAGMVDIIIKCSCLVCGTRWAFVQLSEKPSAQSAHENGLHSVYIELVFPHAKHWACPLKRLWNTAELGTNKQYNCLLDFCNGRCICI